MIDMHKLIITRILVLTAALTFLAVPYSKILSQNATGPIAIQALDWSPDGSKIAIGRFDGSFQIVDVATNQASVSLQGATLAVQSVDWSPDGTKVAIGYAIGYLQVVDAASGQTVQEYRNGDEVSAVAWSPDGSSLAATNRQGS